MRDLPLSLLRSLAAVYAEGGVRPAAKRLSVEHSTISRALHELERWLGTPLTEARSRGQRLRLTQQGEVLGDAALSALRDLENATAKLREASGSSSPHHRLWRTDGFCHACRASRRTAKASKYPSSWTRCVWGIWTLMQTCHCGWGHMRQLQQPFTISDRTLPFLSWERTHGRRRVAQQKSTGFKNFHSCTTAIREQRGLLGAIR